MELYGYQFARESDLKHHGILGQKWGVRRYQNKDGTLTNAGKQRYQADLEDAKRLGKTHANLEAKTRALRSGIKSGNQILVPTDVKADYKKTFDEFINESNLMRTKYGEATSDIVSMNDGYDYVRVLPKDRRLDGYVEYYHLIGKSEKH